VAPDRLDTLVQQDRQLEAAAAKCRAEVASLDRRLREAARTNPNALEPYFNIDLFENRDGSVARTPGGAVKGYSGRYNLPHWDEGLNALIGAHVFGRIRKCNVPKSPY